MKNIPQFTLHPALCFHQLFLGLESSVMYFQIYFFKFSLYRYVAQVYYIITKIKWEYDTPPNILKGGTGFAFCSYFWVYSILCVVSVTVPDNMASLCQFVFSSCSALWCRPGNSHQHWHLNAISEWHKRPAVGLCQHWLVDEGWWCSQKCCVHYIFVCLFVFFSYVLYNSCIVSKIKHSRPLVK